MKCQAAFEDWFVLRTDLNLQVKQCCPHAGKKHLAVQKSNSSNVWAIHYYLAFQNASLQDINRGWISFSTIRGRRIWICWTSFQINQMKILFLDGWHLFSFCYNVKKNKSDWNSNQFLYFLFIPILLQCQILLQSIESWWNSYFIRTYICRVPLDGGVKKCWTG